MHWRKLAAELVRRDRVLVFTGWLHLFLFVIMLAVAPFDSRTVAGVNTWFKPMKFALSITVYVWTVAWLLGYLAGPRWAKQLIRWGVATAMIFEIACLMLQAGRGVPSHYNLSTPFDAVVFSLMGIMIFVNTLLAVLLLVLFFRSHSSVAVPYRWGIRAGILVFLLGSLVGMVMIFNRAHTVGMPDGGPGLPFLNWSLVAGDLRIAHWAGLHALQILPLLGWLASRWPSRFTTSQRLVAIGTMALLYLTAVLLAFGRAWQGRPLLTV